jgi:carotenoid cleavage dioxygenase-like enzyme
LIQTLTRLLQRTQDLDSKILYARQPAKIMEQKNQDDDRQTQESRLDYFFHILN